MAKKTAPKVKAKVSEKVIKRDAKPAGEKPVAAKPVKVSVKVNAPAKKLADKEPVNGQTVSVVGAPSQGNEGGVLSEDELRKVKTGLSKKDIEHYRALLLEKRGELLGDVDSLQSDAKNDVGNLSNMPLHMADVGSDNYEQEFTLGLVEADRRLLREIDQALLRIKHGFYGVCLESGKPIARPRLDAQPWAKYCVEVAREMERRGGRR